MTSILWKKLELLHQFVNHNNSLNFVNMIFVHLWGSVTLCDLVFQNVCSKKVTIPVLNQSNLAHKFKRGETIGRLTTIDSIETADNADICGGEQPIFSNDASVNENTRGDLNKKDCENLKQAVNKYQKAIEKIPLGQLSTLLIEHKIELSEIKDNWDSLLKLLAYAYNSSIHTRTGFTPAELFYGRKFRQVGFVNPSIYYMVQIITVNFTVLKSFVKTSTTCTTLLETRWK